MIGITAYGAYVPRLRLSRQAALEANGWFNGALKGLAKGERAMCNWDEDAVTMAVEAARDCLNGVARDDVASLILASTTLPFADRQNATIAAEALNLGEDIATLDVSSSLRCGTSALIAGLDKAASGSGPALVVSAERRKARAASAQELQYGDGAAGFAVGTDTVIADLVGHHQVSSDFVDHYRGEAGSFDYFWEERWARDEGLLKILPSAIGPALRRAKIAASDIDHAVLPLAPASARRVAKITGLNEAALSDPLAGVMGDAGAAQPLVMLANVLQGAGADETILVAGYGQGADILIFRTTDAIKDHAKPSGVPGALARGRTETNYNRYLAFNGLIEQEKGIRAEVDAQTAVSALYRNRKMVLGFVGGRCTACGTVQFPRGNVCVNPNCGKTRTQEDHPMSDAAAKIQSWTADNLTYTPDPPHHFGMVVFEDGGRLMADFTDVDPGTLDVGTSVRMAFRVKDYDERRGFRRYFWKAVPLQGEG